MPPAGRSAANVVCVFLVRVEDLPVALAVPVCFAVVLSSLSPPFEVALSVSFASLVFCGWSSFCVAVAFVEVFSSRGTHD
jgi:hypothetical protein